MASFFDAAIRLALRRRPTEGRMAEMHAQNLGFPPSADVEAAHPAAPIAPNGNVNNNIIPVPASGAMIPGADRRHPVYIRPEDDPLTFFRLMLGIQTTPYLGFTMSSPLGTRPAANIGLYARVISSEQKAKDSFKVFSVVINGCYFLQIVIAAALTALGAARAASGAVTAFGALNTVIAGFLTFLKGSGLPGRLKYYGNEWKKIREFIEQRERDFMRTGHNLNVYEVIETIEKMYNNLKADIELNTPDSYTSLTNQRRTSENPDKVGGMDVSKLESIANKLNGLAAGGKLEGIASTINKKVEEVKNTVHEGEKRLENGVERVKQEVDHAKQEMHHTRGQIIRVRQNVQDQGEQLAKDQEARARAAIQEGKQTARGGVESQLTRLDRTVDEQRQKLDYTVDEQRRRLDQARQEQISNANEQQARALATINETGRAAQEQIGYFGEQHTRALANINETGRATAQEGIDSANERHARALAALKDTGRVAQEGISSASEQHARVLNDTGRLAQEEIGRAGEQHTRALNEAGRVAQEGIGSAAGQASTSATGLVQELSNIHQTALLGGRRAAAQQIRDLAQRLEDRTDDDDDENRRWSETNRPDERRPNDKQPETR